MSKAILAALALLLTATTASHARGASSGSSNYALGIHLGAAQDGSGFSGVNFRVGQDESLDLVGAWNTGSNGTIILNGNYLHHVAPILRQVPIKGIVPYVGIGVGAWFNDNSGAWIQVPLGLDLRFNVPLEVGLYIAPGIDLLPSTKANLHGGIAFRYWL
jgi:hypothetical protein